jgi:hypothetical protein
MHPRATFPLAEGLLPEPPERAIEVQLPFLEFPQHAGEIPASTLREMPSSRVETSATATAAYSRPITRKAWRKRLGLIPSSPASHSEAPVIAAQLTSRPGVMYCSIRGATPKAVPVSAAAFRETDRSVGEGRALLSTVPGPGAGYSRFGPTTAFGSNYSI